jgi:4-hydroxybenzoate polyprenyltransferase
MPQTSLKTYFLLIRADKPIGFLLLLWPTAWAIWLASAGRPSLSILLIFFLGTFLMRAAGCVVNDLADRRFDRQVLRTQARPLASGAVSVKEAGVILVLLLGLSFGLVLQLNRFTVGLAFVGLGLTIVYPFLKRWTHLPQLGLGLAFSWGIPLSFAAVQNQVPSGAWLLFCVALIWPVIYDTMYALQDKTQDIQIGVKSTTILFGDQLLPILCGLQIVFIVGLFCVGHWFHLQTVFFLNLVLIGVLCIYQLKLTQQGYYLEAFKNNNWVGLLIFLSIALGYLS